MGRRSYPGAAVATTLSSPITSSQASLQVVDAAGYPDPATQGPFAIRVGNGTPNEEKILVGARSGTMFSDLTRGYDGTTAVSHSGGDTVEACWTATDADENNAHINSSTGVHGLAPGEQVVGASRPQTIIAKVMSGLQNTFVDIPMEAVSGLTDSLSGVNSVLGNLGSQVAQNILDIAARYTKTEVDNLLSGPLLPSSVSTPGSVTASDLVATGSISADVAITVGGRTLTPMGFAPQMKKYQSNYGSVGSGTTKIRLNQATQQVTITADANCNALVLSTIPFFQFITGPDGGSTTYMQHFLAKNQEGTETQFAQALRRGTFGTTIPCGTLIGVVGLTAGVPTSIYAGMEGINVGSGEAIDAAGGSDRPITLAVIPLG